ncbi:uncharacterized protein LOC123547684 [Mercenaria mercenaria]|uniref:uncharacterized protein LOC123547684 n=1 Tax=Mercenaria mercenaria TaxID=6596 RepID=UPI001E1D5DB5|nr:uncharacterized protein LOC123547684 [Mercenaria mercenaria]
MVDLGKKLKFPEEVTHTSLQRDVVMWSRSPKLVVLVKLTVPWEERADEAYELREGKYQDLADTCRDRGWKTWVFPVEVGCRGFLSQSVWRMLGAVGIKGSKSPKDRIGDGSMIVPEAITEKNCVEEIVSSCLHRLTESFYRNRI